MRTSDPTFSDLCSLLASQLELQAEQDERHQCAGEQLEEATRLDDDRHADEQEAAQDLDELPPEEGRLVVLVQEAERLAQGGTLP